MKRYSFGLDADANWWVFESKQGDYYRRDDLIAAGCLVPVRLVPFAEMEADHG